MKPLRGKASIRQFFESSPYVKWTLLTTVTVIFTLILSPNLIITETTYKLGDVAERDFKAPSDFMVEDKEATEENRRQATANVLTVYDHDVALAGKLSQRLSQAFSEYRNIVESTKRGLVETPAESPDPAQKPAEKNPVDPLKQVLQLRESFEEKIGIPVNKAAYGLLVQEGFPKDVSDLIHQILTEILDTGVVSNKEILLRETDKGIILRTVGGKSEIEVHGLKRFYGLDQAKTMVRIVGQPLLQARGVNMRNLVVEICQHLIQPNITLNRSETEERKKQAAEKIEPTLYKIKAGEMVLREGEVVTEVQSLKLKMLQGKTRQEQVLASSIGAAMILLCLLSTTYIIYTDPKSQQATRHNKYLLFIATVLVLFLLLSRFSATLADSLAQQRPFSIPAAAIPYCIPLASGAMVICLFLGLQIAIPFATVLAACAAFILQNQLDLFVYFLISGSMAAYWVQSCRERKVFIKAGMKLAFLNVILATAIGIYRAEFSEFRLLWDWAFALMGGIGAGMVTAGIVPLMEVAFDYPTDITLLELANHDRPILRRLMIEAPGTYHHSVIVGSLVEAAAAEIGANPLQAKVCGYYHDIGKIGKPLYFIENQTDGKNKHDKLAPSMSSLILISHIKEGVEIAKANKLGQVINDTIRQHHGTSLIRYFYEKAKQQKGEAAVNIDNYRYPGPKPQTREAGLVMLADVVEAASRTLENPTPSRIQGLVQNLINKVFSDGQLDDCELTLKDLHSIAKSFNTILNGIHHHRIEYTESPSTAKGKPKNGSSDRQPPKNAPDIAKENGENGAGHLKRLGLS